MKYFIFATTIALTITPVWAQDDGMTLMERGAKLFMEGILQEMEPTIEDLKDLAGEMQPALKQFVEQMGPALGDMLGSIENLNAYEMPEMLPNGDIIIRRKPDMPLDPVPELDEIEL